MNVINFPRRVYNATSYYFLVLNVIVGIFSCLKRILIPLALGILFLSRLDQPFIIRGFETKDPGNLSHVLLVYSLYCTGNSHFYYSSRYWTLHELEMMMMIMIGHKIYGKSIIYLPRPVSLPLDAFTIWYLEILTLAGLLSLQGQLEVHHRPQWSFAVSNRLHQLP